MSKVVYIGELPVDFVPKGRLYLIRPGGAPANVAVNLARLGVDASLVSKVGEGNTICLK